MARKVIEGSTMNYNLGDMQRISSKVNDLINPMVFSTSDIILNEVDKYNDDEISLLSLQDSLSTQLGFNEEENLSLFTAGVPIIYDDLYRSLNYQTTYSIKKNINLFFDDDELKENAENLNIINTSSRSDFNDLMLAIVTFYFYKINKKVNNAILADNFSDMKTYLSSQRRITRKKSKLDLNDNYRDTFGALAESKLKSNGINKWQWIYTYRSHTERPWHVNYLRNKIFDNNNPPIIDPKTKVRGYPGQLPNCKCRMRPILEID